MDRATFVSTLCTAQLRLFFVITSRESGYRHIAASIVTLCRPAVLSVFCDDDIAALTVARHREVLGILTT